MSMSRNLQHDEGLKLHMRRRKSIGRTDLYYLMVAGSFSRNTYKACCGLHLLLFEQFYYYLVYKITANRTCKNKKDFRLLEL